MIAFRSIVIKSILKCFMIFGLEMFKPINDPGTITMQMRNSLQEFFDNRDRKETVRKSIES